MIPEIFDFSLSVKLLLAYLACSCAFGGYLLYSAMKKRPVTAKQLIVATLIFSICAGWGGYLFHAKEKKVEAFANDKAAWQEIDAKCVAYELSAAAATSGRSVAHETCAHRVELLRSATGDMIEYIQRMKYLALLMMGLHLAGALYLLLWAAARGRRQSKTNSTAM